MVHSTLQLEFDPIACSCSCKDCCCMFILFLFLSPVFLCVSRGLSGLPTTCLGCESLGNKAIYLFVQELLKHWSCWSESSTHGPVLTWVPALVEKMLLNRVLDRSWNGKKNRSLIGRTLNSSKRRSKIHFVYCFDCCSSSAKCKAAQNGGIRSSSGVFRTGGTYHEERRYKEKRGVRRRRS